MNRLVRAPAVWPALLLGLLSFVATVVWREESRTSEELSGRRAELVRIIETRQRHAADLETRLARLRGQLAELAARGATERLRETQALADRIASVSGTAPVGGPGIIVELADASDADRERDADPDLLVQDVDIQAVVNALWDAGAEAVAVGGQRVVSTTAIRNAGAAVLVNYRVLSGPYRVEAIGNGARLQERFGRSEIARRFRGWADVYGLGFKVAQAKRLALPSFTGSLRFKYAHPIEEG